MRNMLRGSFGIAMVLGAMYLADGKPKGPVTLAYQTGLVAVGLLGTMVMLLIDFMDKGRPKP